MSEAAQKETLSFQAEVRQLLDLMIHSLYSNKEIFLRELISNASDAADKLRFAALSDDSLYEGNPNLEIRITFDKEAKTITISDNGIGMNRDEVMSNIGTIAKSGTKEFLQSLSGEQAKDAHLIGQFGVGFYSAFVVADRVTLITRRAGATAGQGVKWESAGDGEYTLEEVAKEGHGTEVTLHLRDEEGDFLDDWRLRSVIRKFSDHVSWPIMMKGRSAAEEESEEEKQEEGQEEKEKVVEEKWEQVNKASALWTRAKSEISAEEYNEFYKHIAHDFEDPLSHLHVRLEGKYEYTLLLYLPKRAPFDLWDRERKHGVKLYVRRVFIMEGAEELMPRYFRFVRGLIDTSDLPLNVSREILQKNQVVDAIRKGAVGKVFTMLEELAEKEPEKYQTFWKIFGKVLKEGIIEDYSNKERLAKLLRFATTQSDSEVQDVSLSDYIARMKPEQEKIYYITGETHMAARKSPHLEIFRKKGIEVLLLSDRVDEWFVSHLHEFDGKSLQAVTKGDLDLGKLDDEEQKKEREEQESRFKDLVTRIKNSLGDSVKEVRTTHRLVDSPSCLVGGEYDMSATMERILKDAGQDVPGAKRVLEINPEHALLVRLQSAENSERFDDLCHILYNQALLCEGGQIEDPVDFVRRLNNLL
ncbi:molecular chaperone HtpG [Candidatus Magnetaquicoccus inordinatus]|uniref:molecular chaperone HtpG n=1 Tax=Candidatus Magnetaquicoccus inordinatus TaxID=2496818 RepID=UPI00102C8F7D|nr:molecular chaperone HtpG [Candidatus Magnetaquicoccus inordinatus]